MLNATLIVQIIHFYIVYRVLDKLVLKKAVILIKDKKSQEKALLLTIKNEQDAITDVRDSVNSSWDTFKQTYKKSFILRPDIGTVNVPEQRKLFDEKPSDLADITHLCQVIIQEVHDEFA